MERIECVSGIRLALGLVLVMSFLTAFLLTGDESAKANQLVEITIPDRGGEIPPEWISYDGEPRAMVLLPDGCSPRKRYPLLILLAGANSNYRTWSDEKLGRIKTTAAGFPGIIVMPEGSTGFYADWWNNGKYGAPRWESYYMDEVIPQILERYRIRSGRRWHALAGVSMGGLGTAYLSGRLPGFFGSIGIISGVASTHLFPGFISAATLIGQVASGRPVDPEDLYGPEEGFYAYGHDPVRLAENQQHTRVYMAAGNGVPTNDGEPLTNLPLTDIPAEVGLARPASDNYAAALKAAGVDLTYEVHDGIHDFANSRPELRDAIAWDFFAPVEEAPDSWVNDSVATRGRLWEFDYRFDSPPDRIVRFEQADGWLHVSGAGSAVTLTTDQGCSFHIDTPGTIRVPTRPCRKLKIRVKPKRVRTGRSVRLRVKIVPRVPGTTLRIRSRRVHVGSAGLARLRVCAGRPGRIKVTATAPGYLKATARVKVRGKPRSCGGRAA
jgi:S-formylglutathione hydrolase FrmB